MSADRYAPRSGDDILSLVDQNPLAWIVLTDAQGPFATAAPVRPTVAAGRLSGLVGHVPRGRRVARCLAQAARGLVLVIGPHGYVSPSWMSDRTQAPTWNFASAQFVADFALVDDPAFLERHLRDLTALQERSRSRAWSVDEMGPRFHELARRIVAFEAKIVHGEGRFKLGQDENDRAWREIARGLEREGNPQLLRWMRDFDPTRD